MLLTIKKIYLTCILSLKHNWMTMVKKCLTLIRRWTQFIKYDLLGAKIICAILKTLVVGKASGPGCINNRNLKESAESITHPFTNLFNSSLISPTIPAILKRANVSHIHKKDDKSSIEIYRPISLLVWLVKFNPKKTEKNAINA